MKVIRKAGATSNILQIFIADSSSTTGAGLTGLVFNTASLTAYYHKDTDTTATAITLVTMTVGTFTSSGFKEIDATNMPGWYQFCPPDAAFTSAKSVGFHLKGATNMAPLPIEIDLDAQADVTHWNGTAVSSPATAGIPDVNVKNINNVAAATPGASGGVLISGSNSGTTTLAALTCTGSLTISDGLLVSRSTSNTSAITATGNGTGSGMVATSGAGATGDGIQAISNATNGNGLSVTGKGTGQGQISTGGATGNGQKLVGGSTSGAGLLVTTTAGDGLTITPTAGNAITATANGTSKHGIVSTGGTAGTSDGIKGVAGTGGVDIRGNITGNLVGTASTVTTVTNRVTANADQWAGGTIPAPNVTGVPLVDLKYTLGTISPATPGSVRTDMVTNSVSNSGTAQAGTINTITLANAASSTNGTYDPSIVRLTGGTGTGQARLIIDYAGATRIATVDRDWRTAPDATTTYDILPATNLLSTNEGLAQAGAASTITLNANASTVDNTYNGQIVVLRTGTGQDQSRIITGYVGSTKVATVDSAWVTNPTSSTGYMVLQSSRMDATISSRLASASYTAPPTATQNADALLNRDMSAVSDTTARSPLNALRAIRNKVSIAAGTVTVTKEDDTTSAWTGAVTTDAAAAPIIAVDPA